MGRSPAKMGGKRATANNRRAMGLFRREAPSLAQK
jgi:hypothetical protein